MPIKILQLDGLNDTELCRLTERKLLTIEGVKDAKIDFLSQRLTISYEKANSDYVVEEALSAIRKVMPDASVKLLDLGSGEDETPKRMPARQARVRDEDWGPPEPEDEDEDDDEEDEDGGFLPSESLPPYLSTPIVAIAIATGLFLLAQLPAVKKIALLFSLASYLLLTLSIFIPDSGRWFTKNHGASFTTIAVTAAMFLTGGQKQAVLAMLFYRVGLLFATFLYDSFDSDGPGACFFKTRELGRIREDTVEQVTLDQVVLGDTILIMPGETVPFDGVVEKGKSRLELSPLVAGGRALEVSAGEAVFCGDRNLGEALTMKVTRMGGLSSMLWVKSYLATGNGENPTALLVRRAAVLISALLAAGGVFWAGWQFGGLSLESLEAVLPCLLAACPIGLTFVERAAAQNGIGSAVKSGILIRGKKSLDRLAGVKSAIFGYTGVLTEGVYRVTKIMPCEGLDQNLSPEEILEIAAQMENGSEHPIAAAILEEYQRVNSREVVSKKASMVEAIPGYGIRGMYDGRITMIGSKSLMEEAGVDVPQNDNDGLCIYLSVRGECIGSIFLEDPVKPEACSIASRLRAAGVEKNGILSGCDASLLQTASHKTGIDGIHSAPTSAMKLQELSKLNTKLTSKESLAFAAAIDQVVLAEPENVKLVMDGGFLEKTLYACDAAIPSRSPGKAVLAIRMGKHARGMVVLSVVIAAAVKGSILLLCMKDLAPFSLAAIGNAALMILTAFLATYRWRGGEEGVEE